MTKQFSSACERNREPILAVLREVFADNAMPANNRLLVWRRWQ